MSSMLERQGQEDCERDCLNISLKTIFRGLSCFNSGKRQVTRKLRNWKHDTEKDSDLNMENEEEDRQNGDQATEATPLREH